MGMSYNILPLENFAYVQQTQPTYQIATANVTPLELNHQQQTQMFITSPVPIYNTRQEKQREESRLQEQQTTFFQAPQLASDPQPSFSSINQQQIVTVTPVNSEINNFVNVDYRISDNTSSSSTTITLCESVDRPMVVDAISSNFLTVQPIATNISNTFTVPPVELTSNTLNLIQVNQNLLLANNNLILCLPPEGITLQLQQPIGNNILQPASTTVVSADSRISKNNLTDKAREWLKDSGLVNRGLIAFNKIK